MYSPYMLEFSFLLTASSPAMKALSVLYAPTEYAPNTTNTLEPMRRITAADVSSHLAPGVVILHCLQFENPRGRYLYLTVMTVKRLSFYLIV